MSTIFQPLSVLLVIFSGVLFVVGRKRNRFIALNVLLLGAALVLFLAGVTFTAADKAMTMELKLRAATGLLSFLVLVVTMEAVRRTQMRERYALLWLGIHFHATVLYNSYDAARMPVTALTQFLKAGAKRRHFKTTRR